MSLAIYMDEHVKSAVTDGLRARGINVLTAQEDGYARRDDGELLARAWELRRIMFTEDDHFLNIAQEWRDSSREFAGIGYAHQMAVTIGGSINDLQLICEAVSEEESRNTIIYLPF